MGEYANYLGAQIKIGTCEDMYYLRADQIAAVKDYAFDPETLAVVRFRFPWPDEDGTAPGAFGDPERKIPVWGASDLIREIAPDPEQHYSVQFVAREEGYVISLPCPEVNPDQRIGRNGFRGSVFVSQQAYRRGHLVTIVDCACGAKFRLETLALAERVAVALRSDADRATSSISAEALHTIADRILAGYSVPVPA